MFSVLILTMGLMSSTSHAHNQPNHVRRPARHHQTAHHNSARHHNHLVLRWVPGHYIGHGKNKRWVAGRFVSVRNLCHVVNHRH